MRPCLEQEEELLQGPSWDQVQDLRARDQVGAEPCAGGGSGRGGRGARGSARTWGPCAPAGDKDQMCAGVAEDLPSQEYAT